MRAVDTDIGNGASQKSRTAKGHSCTGTRWSTARSRCFGKHSPCPLLCGHAACACMCEGRPGHACWGAFCNTTSPAVCANRLKKYVVVIFRPEDAKWYRGVVISYNKKVCSTPAADAAPSRFVGCYVRRQVFCRRTRRATPVSLATVCAKPWHVSIVSHDGCLHSCYLAKTCN